MKRYVDKGEHTRVYEALLRLEQSHDFQTVVKWLGDTREEIRETNEAPGNTDPHRSGQSFCLTEILRAVENARETLQRLRG